VQLLGDPDLPHTYSYVPDIARGLVALANDDRALGSAWHLPSANAVSSREFARMVFEAAGHPPKVQRVGKPLLKLAGLFSPTVRELQEMLYEFEEPFIVDNSRFTATFGIEPTPLRDAIAATVAWFQSNPA
jgi:nucleoside-diphosphate-sugar epimerase